MKRTILHVDFDSFFASCEQHFNPNLRGKPIGVTAENGRNCVIAASREAKERGVKSPNTTWEAKRICPEIIFVKADFERYFEITKKLLSISVSYSPIVELFSLDEVFIDLTPVIHLHGSVFHVVEKFKQQLRNEVGQTVTVSMGASHNKLLAKLATNLDKPDGFYLIDNFNKDKVLSQIELTDIMGIGERYKRRLNLMGIFNFRQLQECPLYLLKAEFGNIASQNLKALSFGLDDSPIVSYQEEIETKSVGRNYCLPKNEYNHENILKTIHELCEEIAIKLRRLKMRGRTIGLYLHGNESEGGRKTVPRYVNQSSDIFGVCISFFKKWDLSYVRQVSVWVTNLIDENYTTPSMFENPKKEDVARLVDQINDRFGHHTIRSGYLVYAPKLHTKPNGYLADRWQREELRGL
jgi:DNA polymerase-4